MENGNGQEDRDRTISLSSMRKMPEVPDMTGKLVTPKKDSPFALSDWGGGSPANTTKP